MSQTHLPAPGGRPKSSALLIGVAIGVLVIAGAGVIWMMMLNKPAPVATQPSEPAKPVAVVLDGPAIEADATALINLFKDKQEEAEAKYNGKVVDVTGSISAKLDGNLDGTRAIALEGGVQRFAGVRCVLKEANYFQLADLERGETVTIRGRCEGLTTDVVLRDCAVIRKVP
ncbi:OB-fold protein [Humisphaera borealis]|uniref:tRNA_anti-like n=1 Tax=Humisphaera borealis TaxID=2807512 RepID=A0A7M2WU87_9BACT|nr:hypothetical protein [Humisphaera borealis]QOV88732.1 hypothetical protein IPV69_21255 [Humisphaera borealis]